MLPSRGGLKLIYANAVDKNSIRATLDEMLARGLPREIYDKYLNEAIESGLIPVIGRSRINGRLMTKDDILTKEDILSPVKESFKDNRYWYGIG